MRSRVFYGWRIVAASAIGLGMGASVTPLFTLGVFTKPLAEFLQAPRASISFCQLVITMGLMLAAPFSGWLADRVSNSRVITTSMILYGIGFLSMPLLITSVSSLYVAYFALTVIGCGTTGIAFTKLVSRWFDRQRGLALGSTLAGVGLCGAVLPPVVAHVISRNGWQYGFVTLGCVVLGIALPAAAVFLKDDPAQLRLAPDGMDAARALAPTAKPPADSLVRVASNSTLWLLVVSFFLMGAAFGIVVYLVPMLTDQGLQPSTAALVQGAMGVSTIFGRVMMGYLMDRVPAVGLGMAFLLGPIVGIPLLAIGVPFPVAILCAVMIGLAQGTETDLLAYLVGRYFGLALYGRIYAIVFTCFTLGAAAAGLMLAQVQQYAGNYVAGSFILSFGLAITVLVLMRLPPYSRPNRNEESNALPASPVLAASADSTN